MHIKKTLVHPKANEEKRTTFKNRIAKYKEEGRSIVYIDESGFAHDMPRTHGYSTVGERCYSTQHWNAKGRTNVISGLSGDSLIGCGIVNANVDTYVFNTWLEKILIPDLPQNSIVVMDNASFHKSDKTTKILSEHRHKIEFLPPYSPDLNPIESKWAQAKSIRRKLHCDVFELFASHIM